LYKLSNLLAFLFSLLPYASLAQRTNEEYTFEKELEQTLQLIVMISVDYDGEGSGVGAGIVFARDGDRILIVTASHVIQKGPTTAKNVLVRFKSIPDKSFKATVLKHINNGESLDLAVLSVTGDPKQGLSACAFPFDRLRWQRELERKDEVIPIGNPNGRSWEVPVESDKIAEIFDAELVFQSNNIKSGHSGGALIDTKANLIGMVTADEAPLGHAMTIEALLKQLKQWKFPVLWSRSVFREDRRDMPLHIAADSVNIPEIKKLLAECSNPNEIDFYYRTPLHYAASQGSVEALSLLIKAGAMIDVQDFNEMYPLSLAIYANHTEAVKFLVKSGAKINKPAFKKLTALHMAFDKEINPQIAIHLIQAGANVNAVDEDGNTPLHYAVGIKNIDIVKAMIKAGAELELENGEQNTALMIAAASDDLPMIQLLIASGAVVKAPASKKGHDVLHTAAYHSNNLETVKILLRAGANINGRDEAGNTPLLYAVWKANSKTTGAEKMPELITLLLSAGADPNAKSERGITPLSVVQEAQKDAAVNGEEVLNRMNVIGGLLRKHGAK
jgi:ankyrin repeat protein